MKHLKSMVVFGGVMFGALMSATAGVQGVVTTKVETLSGTVTYSTTGDKPLNTKVGYSVTITRSGTNTVNNVQFKGTADVIVLSSGLSNSAESANFIEANDDGGACSVGAAAAEVVCNFGQMRPGDSKTFAVFFKGPVESDGNCFVAGGPTCEVVRFRGTTNYSEGANDNSESAPNDQSEWVWVDSEGVPLVPQVPQDVPLGTPNPTQVKSALAKSGGEFFTGTDAIPLSTFGFATKLIAPNPPVFSSASISLKKLIDNTQAQLCSSAGNFNNCYEADVSVPEVIYVPSTDPLVPTQYLKILLRIDSNEVKSPFRKERVTIYYGDGDVGQAVQPCQTSGLPPVGLERCVANIFRYSNSGSNGELRGDVEVEIHAYKNAFYRPR
jgi:hypothetical protein